MTKLIKSSKTILDVSVCARAPARVTRYDLYFRNWPFVPNAFEQGKFDRIKKENGRIGRRSSYVVVDKESNFRAYADAMTLFVEEKGISAYNDHYQVNIAFSNGD